MIIGVPKEIKNNENRVGLTPAGAKELIAHGHQVYVQATAGEGTGFSDAEYEAAGAKILPTIEDVYGIAEMIINTISYAATRYSSHTSTSHPTANSQKPCCAQAPCASPTRP